MVGAEVVRFVPLKRCTLWRWGCAPKNTRAEANPSTKTELSHKMNEVWKSSPAWGAWEILRPGVFPSESIIARSQPPVSAVSPWDNSVFAPESVFSHALFGTAQFLCHRATIFPSTVGNAEDAV